MPRLKNKRWERFAREYVRNGFNASAAARAVGYSVISCSQQGARIIANEQVMNRIDEFNDDINNDVIMNAQELMAEASSMAKANIKDCYDEDGALIHPSQLDESVTVNISEVQALGANVTSIKFGKDKKFGMDLIAKSHNLFEAHQKSGATTVFMDEKDAQC